MALVQLTDHQRIVCHMSVSGSIWANSFIVKKTGGTTLSGAESVVTKIHDFFKGMTPNAGFIETLTGYNVYQHHAGDAEIDHPPQWQNTYHEAGTHDANFNGAPLGTPLPKDVVVFAKLATSGGRSGKLFVRNLLEEGDVDSAVSGVWEFSAGSSRFTVARFATLVTGTIAANLVGGGDAGNHLISVAHLLEVSATDVRAPFSTGVTAVTAIRPTWNKAHR